VGYVPGSVLAQRYLGYAAIELGDDDAAHLYTTATLAAARAVDDQREVGYLLRMLGVLAFRAGDLRQARARAEESLVEVRRALLREALEPLRRGRVALGRAERGVELARLRMGAAGARLDEYARAFGRLGRGALRQAGKDRAELASRLAAAALRGVERGAGERVRLAERLAGSARARVREARAGLEGRARLCAELAPERTLARGFSITRDRAGRLLRHPAQAAAGDRITTRVAGGELSSRVEEP